MKKLLLAIIFSMIGLFSVKTAHASLYCGPDCGGGQHCQMVQKLFYNPINHYYYYAWVEVCT